MKKPIKYFIYLILCSVIIGLIGCAGGQRGTLKRTTQVTENGLKQNWREYTVYYGRTALVYKINHDRKIVLPAGWVEVTTENMLAESRILDSTSIAEILGQNDELYGYLVHRSADVANVKIIDEKTVQLYYHYIRTSGGP